VKEVAEQIVRMAVTAYRMHPHDFDLQIVARNAEAMLAEFIVEATAGDRGGEGANVSEYQIDLDPVHQVIRLTITSEIMTLECAKEIHDRLTKISSNGGPYAAIFDLSLVKGTTIPTDMVRTMARDKTSVPVGRPHVIVGGAPVIFGLARLFQMCGEGVKKDHEVVHTLEEAYEIVKAAPEDFTQRL
jgi:hypothetical protein